MADDDSSVVIPEAESAEDKFAAERSHKASALAYDLCRVTAQACLLINGGAATAVLALLAKDKVDPTLFHTVPWSLGFYALGVTVSAVMMSCTMMMADYWPPSRRQPQAKPDNASNQRSKAQTRPSSKPCPTRRKRF
jgi:hypothetical protein